MHNSRKISNVDSQNKMYEKSLAQFKTKMSHLEAKKSFFFHNLHHLLLCLLVTLYHVAQIQNFWAQNWPMAKMTHIGPMEIFSKKVSSVNTACKISKMFLG